MRSVAVPSVLLLSVAGPSVVLLNRPPRLAAARLPRRSPFDWSVDFRLSALESPVSPAQLANLAPAVIFADANILSYRADLSDPGPAGLNTVRRAGPQGDVGRPGGPERATMATSDACPADNAGNPSSDRESTITLFFTADSGVNRVSREYTLWRQVNDSAPVATVHHVLRDGRLPFLEYRYVVPTEGGADTLATVPRALLPISRRDTVSSVVDVRALRAVEWHFLVPLDSASHPRIARVHLVTSLPGISQLDRHECREVSRDPPLLAQRESDGSDDVSPHQPRARPPAIG